jgi:hypothetical protein
MEEDELRALCVTLANLLRQSEMNRMICINEALQHGYREGYADGLQGGLHAGCSTGALQLPSAVKERDAESLVLH